MSKQADTAGAGVPVGGIGTGAIEFGPDGCFRAITINNNRWAAERIPLAPHAFTAVWARVGGSTTARMLQTQSGLPWGVAGLEAPVLDAGALRFEALYPAALYRVAPPAFPLEVRWKMKSLLVPFDSRISSLPLIMATVRFRNRGKEAVEASALWNWENLNGCKAGHFPVERGRIRPRALTHEPGHGREPETLAWGLMFGDEKRPQSNAEGTYYLAGRYSEGVQTTVMTWDAETASEFRAFWKGFEAEGDLGDRLSRSHSARMGAVCCRTSVPPGGEVTMRLYFTWHCPRFEVAGTDWGNHYASHTGDAIEALEFLLQHEAYFVNSSSQWQEDLLRSSLPAWLSRAMINSLSTFTTNTLFGRDQQFARLESPGIPGVGRVDRSFHGSLPMLFLFPELEERELLLLAKAGLREGEKGRLAGQIGSMGFGDGTDERPAPPELLPMMILLACRNATMTGRRALLEHLWPRLRHLLDSAGALDAKSQPLTHALKAESSALEPWRPQGVTAWLSGLWIAALYAAALLARELNQPSDAEALEKKLGQVIGTFDDTLWESAQGRYRLDAGRDAAAGACHEGQLAGAWYADFLCMGRLFDEGRLRQALATLRRRNERREGVCQVSLPSETPWPDTQGFPAPGTMCPAHAMAHYACSLIHNGEVTHGLEVARRVLDSGHRDGPFGWPMRIDLDQQRAIGAESDRHASAPVVWHLYAALTGFLLDMLTGTVWVRPRLPAGVSTLDVHLFTPICMGRLSWQERDGPPYTQRVALTFDSPVRCQRVFLRVPEGVMDLSAVFESDMGRHPVSMHYDSDGRDHLLRLDLPAGMTATESLKISLREA